MKHSKLFKSLLLALIAALPQLANAYDFKVDELCYNYNEDGTSVTVTFEKKSYYGLGDGYYSLSGDLVIPETVSYNGRTYSVTTIGDYAFSRCTGLTSVTIPNSVTTIGVDAFLGCDVLTSVTIPNSVTSIGSTAFCSCSGLTSMVVESGNTKYDSRNNCNAIIETATNALFIGCKNTVIPNSVTSIGRIAFYACSGLTSITIPNSVTSIGDGAFRDCSGLTSVTIGNSVTSIGIQAFEDCSGLTSVTIPNSVSSIEPYAFYKCTSLTSLIIPNYVTIAEPNAFWYLDNLTSFTITGNGAVFENWIPYNARYITLNIGSGIASLPSLFLESTTINCYAETPPTCDANTFSSYDGELHVPSSATVAYFTTDYWQNFNNMVNDLTDKITLDLTTANLIQGETLTLATTVFPENSELVWSTSNPSVATVDENGVVTATGEGECDIFASLASNLAVYAWCHITTSYPEITLSLSEETVEINLGEVHTLNAIITPDNTGLTPTWSSSNTSVATVDENGKVTAIGEGECDITATVLDQTATCHVTVCGNVILSLNIDNAILGANQMLTVYPSCTPDVPVELVVTSSDPSIAVARIVNRTNAPAQELMSFPEKGMALAMMEELTTPSESKDPTLASTKAIMIVGVQNGTATITVTTADGKAVPAVLELRVVDVNGDNVVTAADVTALYDYLLNEDLTYYDTCDINGDGNITAADITAVYNLLLGN